MLIRLLLALQLVPARGAGALHAFGHVSGHVAQRGTPGARRRTPDVRSSPRPCRARARDPSARPPHRITQAFPTMSNRSITGARPASLSVLTGALLVAPSWHAQAQRDPGADAPSIDLGAIR